MLRPVMVERARWGGIDHAKCSARTGADDVSFCNNAASAITQQSPLSPRSPSLFGRAHTPRCCRRLENAGDYTQPCRDLGKTRFPGGAALAKLWRKFGLFCTVFLSLLAHQVLLSSEGRPRPGKRLRNVFLRTAKTTIWFAIAFRSQKRFFA